MFKLAQRGGDGAGLYCRPDGLFLGPSPLIMRIGGAFRVRAEDQIIDLLAAAYGSPEEGERLRPRLRLIRDALEEGDQCRAMILAVHARLGPVMSDGITRLAQTEALAKYNFNTLEPRDWHGRWAREGNAASGEAGAGNHSALVPVQELLPFAVRPPLFFEEPPETIRPFKETIPRLSGKEGAKNVPSWARGQRPYVGENGRDFAKRLMDQRYGRGNWSRKSDEYSRIQKYGDRNFRDPRSILLPRDNDYI